MSKWKIPLAALIASSLFLVFARGEKTEDTEKAEVSAAVKVQAARKFTQSLRPVTAGVRPTKDRAFLGADEIFVRINRVFELHRVEPEDPRQAAQLMYGSPDLAGVIGIVAPRSRKFCSSCNRLRLTADGLLRPCLFGTLETNLRDPLRAGDDLLPLISQTLRIKPERHDLVQGSDLGSGGLIALSQTGG